MSNITFAEHQENVDRFYTRASRMVKKFDKAGIFTCFLWDGYCQPDLRWALDTVEGAGEGKVTLSASYWCGDSREGTDITIPSSLMDYDKEDDVALDAFIAEKVAERDAILAEKAAAKALKQRIVDEATLAALQKKLGVA